jgi:hypothetical protein
VDEEMTQDEIIEMARQVGMYGLVEGGLIQEFESFAKLVAAKERERCCSIVFAQCESDNVAQRTVDAIRGQQ